MEGHELLIERLHKDWETEKMLPGLFEPLLAREELTLAEINGVLEGAGLSPADLLWSSETYLGLMQRLTGSEKVDLDKQCLRATIIDDWEIMARIADRNGGIDRSGLGEVLSAMERELERLG